MASSPSVVRNSLLLALVGAVIGGVFTFVVPTVWRASAVVVVPPDPGSSSGVGAVLGSGSQVDFILGYATSLPVMQGAVNGVGQVWKEVADGMNTTKNDDFSQITLSSDQRDKQKALKLCRAWLDQLRKTYSQTAFTGSRRLSTYVGTTLHQRETELEKQENELSTMLALMKTAPSGDGGALNIEYEQRLRKAQADLATATATVKAARSVGDRAASDLSNTLVPTADKTLEAKRNNLTDAEVQLRILLTTQGDRAPDVNRQREVVRVLREALRDEAARYVKGLQSGVSLAVADAETDRLVKQQEVASLTELVGYSRTESLAFARKQRDVTALRDTVAELRAEYEKALVEEQVDRSKWEILTPPYIEPKPVNKSYLRNGLAGALLFAVVYLGVWYSRTQLRRES